jgi:Bardet-Biedl syndrome 7 protein
VTRAHVPRQDACVGRDDGTLEIWSCDVGSEPSLIFSRCISESISSVGCGLITTPHSEDVIVASFSGKVIAFSAGSAARAAEAPLSGGEAKKKEKEEEEGMGVKQVTDKDVKKLNAELEALKAKVDKEKAKYAKSSSELIATQHKSRLKASFALDDSDSCNAIVVEIEMPIDCVIVQSTADVDLIDVDSNVAIVSKTTVSEPKPGGSRLLATYRCQETARQMKIKVRAPEGTYGDITAFVIPNQQPKTCQAVTFSIRPLSLHVRAQDLDAVCP